MSTCACGCGAEVKPGNRYVNGPHSQRKTGVPSGVIYDPQDEHIARSVRWRINGDGYVVVLARAEGYTKSGFRCRTKRSFHREILGAGPGVFGDHINGNRLDNRRANLRIAEPSINSQNLGGRKDNTSGFRGVWFSRRKRRWVADAIVNGRKTSIGRFETKEQAGAAAHEWRKLHMPGYVPDREWKSPSVRRKASRSSSSTGQSASTSNQRAPQEHLSTPS